MIKQENIKRIKCGVIARDVISAHEKTKHGDNRASHGR